MVSTEREGKTDESAPPLTIEIRGDQFLLNDKDIGLRIAALEPLPAGTFVRFAGQAEAERAARFELVLFASAAVIAVVALIGFCV
mgnify:CR=1 FL=1